MTAVVPQAWSKLPDGEDLNISAGYFYAGVALVKNSHDAATIQGALADRGLVIDKAVSPSCDYNDNSAPPAGAPAAKDGYRYVSAVAYANKSGASVPWSLPTPLSWFDDTSCVVAWTSPSVAGQAPAPAPTPGKGSTAGTILEGVVIVFGAPLALWGLWRALRR